MRSLQRGVPYRYGGQRLRARQRTYGEAEKVFADTAYADDELQLRRTILARIATLDTSVSDPTDEQLEETAEMLEMVMEVGAPQNDWEQICVKRLLDVVSASLNRAKTPGNPLGKDFQDML